MLLHNLRVHYVHIMTVSYPDFNILELFRSSGDSGID